MINMDHLTLQFLIFQLYLEVSTIKLIILDPLTESSLLISLEATLYSF